MEGPAGPGASSHSLPVDVTQEPEGHHGTLRRHQAKDEAHSEDADA
jgi:hypothetical protein